MSADEIASVLRKTEKNGEIMAPPQDGENMGKDDRKRVVLEFMEEHPLALQPRDIFRNLKILRKITFSVDSVRRYLTEFVEDGLVARIDAQELDNGRIVEAPDDAEAYYIITDEGRNYLRENKN